MDASTIIAGLERRHRQPKWLTVRELSNSTGGRFERRVDLFAIAAWPSGGFETIAYEVKVSRSDFQRDIKQPLKQRHGRLYASQFYFATPPGLLKPEEMPDWAGLIEVEAAEPIKVYAEAGYVETIRHHCAIRVSAPDLPRIHPTWPFVASLMRARMEGGTA